MTMLIVGLGNVGKQYADTRHNAGFLFAESLAQKYNITLSHNKKFFGQYGQQNIGGVDVHVLLPTTLMNLSGQAVAAVMQFYHLSPSQLLVAHDELDIACGLIKLKSGGGHGGHNGLRDIIARIGRTDFERLRIGIGRPAHSNVTSFVLGKITADERIAIDLAINHALMHIDVLLAGNIAQATSYVNAYRSQ